MQKNAKLLLINSVVFCMLLDLPLNVSAASTGMQDGLEASITIFMSQDIL